MRARSRLIELRVGWVFWRGDFSTDCIQYGLGRAAARRPQFAAELVHYLALRNFAQTRDLGRGRMFLQSLGV